MHVEDFEQFLTSEQHVLWEGHKRPPASCRGLHPLLSTREAQHLHFSYPFWTRVELGLNKKTEIYDKKTEISRKLKNSRDSENMLHETERIPSSSSSFSFWSVIRGMVQLFNIFILLLRIKIFHSKTESIIRNMNFNLFPRRKSDYKKARTLAFLHLYVYRYIWFLWYYLCSYLLAKKPTWDFPLVHFARTKAKCNALPQSSFIKWRLGSSTMQNTTKFRARSW